MARMIPTFFDDSTPPGERDVFGWLANGPAGWVVLHQLDLAPWNRNRQTEIDFVVVMPGLGILCIEVKSHETIWYDAGGWHLGAESCARGPFKQAEDAVKSLQRRIEGHLPRLRYIPVAKCVVFPRAAFERPRNVEYSDRELLDRGRCKDLSNRSAFPSALESCLRGAISTDPKLSPLPAGGINPDHLDELLNFLRPVQKRLPGAKQERQARREQVEQVLREQQRPVVQAAGANPRLVVKGGAGTGKTMIAMELARRATEDGQRTGLLCFNQLVGEWIDRQINPRPPGLVVGWVIQRLAEMLDVALPAGPCGPDHWSDDLLAQFLARLSGPDIREQVSFDRLIIDEAQDILARPVLFDCLGKLIRGGVNDGSWVLLGDFDHQVLTSSAQRDTMRAALGSLVRDARPAVWPLSENCRNFEVVGKAALSLGGIEEEIYEGFRRGVGDGSYLRPKVYTDPVHQLQLLRSEIEYWKGRHFQPKDITILSLCRPEDGVGSRLGPGDGPLRRLGQPGHCLSYGSIDEFKGMENEVVILTDIDLDSPGHPELRRKDLFYTGMTRALFGVSVLMTPATSAWVLG